MLPRRLSAVCQIAFLLAATIPAAATATATGACAAPRPMLPDGIERQVEGLTGDADCYRLDLAAAGLWHLSITSPARAVFEILDGAGRRASLEDFERSAAERLTFVPAGVWLIRVRAADPLRPLPAYRLASRFVEAARSEVAWKSQEDGELAPYRLPPSGGTKGEGLVAGWRAFKSEEDGELEIEGEGLVAGCGAFKSEEDGELDSLRWPPSRGTKGEGLVAGCGAFKSEEDGELEIEGEGLVTACRTLDATIAPFLKSEEDGELEIEGEGLVAGCVDRAAEIRRALCSAGDDHGDTLACATPVRCRAHGELDNGWGDDVDAFRFHVDAWRTVEIAACSGFPTRGELFDAAGQHLDAADGDGGFRLVRTLGPGTYFVKVAGASGGYGLEIRTLDLDRALQPLPTILGTLGGLDI